MEISVISFTKAGQKLSEKLKETLTEWEISLFTKRAECAEKIDEVFFVEISISEWTKEQMEQRKALVFIGACGIAVRAVAPNIVSKLIDSPVLVMDEKGRYVIPILSGHVGGANELAGFIAKRLGAQEVITTATDINHKFAVDLFAKKNHLSIVNKEGIAKVSAKILAGEMIKMSIEERNLVKTDSLPENVVLISWPPKEPADVIVSSENDNYDASLILCPQEYVIGAGCRKGKEAEKLEEFIRKNLENAGIKEEQILAIASIDVKKNEAGLLAWSKRKNIPFLTYSEEELRKTEGDFQESEFVKSMVGVGNVCERAAVKAAGLDGRLIYKKHAEDGMTIAIAKREWRITFDET